MSDGLGARFGLLIWTGVAVLLSWSSSSSRMRGRFRGGGIIPKEKQDSKVDRELQPRGHPGVRYLSVLFLKFDFFQRSHF